MARSFKPLNGSVEAYACCDTLQVADYSKYNMASFNEEHKMEMRAKQFRQDMEKGFRYFRKISAGL